MIGNWRAKASCAPANRPDGAESYDWYSNDSDEKYQARAICRSLCPVRKECLQEALINKELWGIHGGVDDYELRRTMSVDADGEPSPRNRAPRCPYCLSRKLDISTKKTSKGYAVTCLADPEKCGMTWHMAMIPPKLKQKKVA